MLYAFNEFLRQVVIYATVYGLTSLGIVIAGRTGVFNIFGEGVMLAAASTGFITAYLSGSWLLGFIAGGLMGVLFGFFMILLHEKFFVNQFILGIGFIILGLGLSDLLYKIIVGFQVVPPRAPLTPLINIPVIGQIPILSALFRQTAIVYVLYISTIIAYWFYYKTKYGLENRAIGENPKAADVMGVNVVKRRLLATVIGCFLIGLAGAYIPIVITGTYSPELSAGRGYMAIGIAIFSSWKPQRAILGSFMFAAVEVIALKLQLMDTWVPYQFFLMLPFVTVLIVMMIFKKQIEWPASIGKLYVRE